MIHTKLQSRRSGQYQIRRLSLKALGFVLLVSLGWGADTVAWAHGDEDHGDVPVTTSAADGRLTAAAQNESFDLVIQYRSLVAGQATSFDIYLSDYQTNAPVGSASIQISAGSTDNGTAVATAETDPGLYRVEMTFPKPGRYDLLFDITSPERSDLIEIKGLEVSSGAAEAPGARYNTTWIAVAVGGAVCLAALAIFLRRGRSKAKRTASALGAALLLFGLADSPVYAHGGEDHGDAGATSTTSNSPGFMSKGSQFLLGVRTTPATTRTVSKQITALGRVVAPPTHQVQVYAPQSGLLVASKEVSYPHQGDWVTRDEPIAVLQVLDQFVIRAPISGIVSAIHAVPGEQVDPAHELFTIYDYTEVWVEANLFENDLIHLEPRPPASLALDIYPGESFPARFVNFDNVVDPNTRTLKAIYEVANPKMTLRPGMVVNVNIESQKRLDALVVPANSIMDWEGQKVVFVHEEPELFEMRPIKILGYYGELVAVEGLLALGDRVVTVGAYELLSLPHRLANGGSK